MTVSEVLLELFLIHWQLYVDRSNGNFAVYYFILPIFSQNILDFAHNKRSSRRVFGVMSFVNFQS